MNPLMLLMLGTQLYSLYEKNKAAKEQQGYQEKQEEHQTKLEDKNEKERRKAGLERALGARVSAMNTRDPSAPKAPDLTGYATRSGVADILGQMGAMGYSKGYGNDFFNKKPPAPSIYDNESYT